MKRIALIALLVGIALIVNAQEQGKEVKPSPTTSPEKPGSVSLQPGATTEAPKKTEKPYGCYKDLRWGMTLEQAQTALGTNLKKGPFPIKGSSNRIRNKPEKRSLPYQGNQFCWCYCQHWRPCLLFKSPV